jgi:hypothetical protein
MKTNQVVYTIFLSYAFLISCSKDNTQKADTYNASRIDTMVFLHSIKGWELYSWPQGNSWIYSIIIGTNRIKTYNEVTSNTIKVSGKDSLRLLLNKFPEDEYLLWIGEGWLSNCWNSNSGDLSLPPDDTLNEIKQYCIEKDLILLITE